MKFLSSLEENNDIRFYREFLDKNIFRIHIYYDLIADESESDSFFKLFIIKFFPPPPPRV